MATWQCSCGTLRVAITPGHGTRLTCYCRDCRAFSTLLGHADTLDPAGGMELYQTTPDRLEMLSGHDKLACLTLTGRGVLRWYASCCNTPFANTLGTPRIPFASVSTAPVTDPEALGPIRARVHAASATGPLPGPAGGTARILLGVLARGTLARLSGRYKITPFFDETGAPSAKSRRVTDEERLLGYPDT